MFPQLNEIPDKAKLSRILALFFLLTSFAIHGTEKSQFLAHKVRGQQKTNFGQTGGILWRKHNFRMFQIVSLCWDETRKDVSKKSGCTVKVIIAKK